MTSASGFRMKNGSASSRTPPMSVSKETPSQANTLALEILAWILDFAGIAVEFAIFVTVVSSNI